MLWPNFRFSIYTKILLSCLLIILPFYLLCLQILLTERNKTRDEILNASRANVHFYLYSIEKEIGNIIRDQSKLVIDEDLLRLNSGKVEKKSYEYYMRINNLIGKLDALADTSEYIANASILLPSQALKIIRGPYTGSNQSAVTDMTEDDFSCFEKNTQSGAFPFYTWGDDICIAISSGYYTSQETKQYNNFLILVRLSETRLLEYLNTVNGEKKGGALFISNQYGLNISNTTDSVVVNTFKEFNAKSFTNDSTGISAVTINNDRYNVLYEVSMLLDSILIIYSPEIQLFDSLNKYIVWIWAISVFTLSIIIVFSVWIRSMVIKPLKILIRAFSEIEKGNLDISVNYVGRDEFAFLYVHFNDMFRKLRVLLDEVYRQKILVKNAELKQLQYQINPHFLYNSILIIQNLIEKKDYDCAIELSQRLSSYYHFIFKGAQNETLLQNEINHARVYSEIQAFRFSNRVQLEFECAPAECHELYVPRLILQPLIENAFKHGLKNTLSNGIIKVSFKESPGYIRVLVEDNGQSLTDEKLQELKRISIASQAMDQDSCLINIHRRIVMKFGPRSGLYFARSELKGLCVELRIGTVAS